MSDVDPVAVARRLVAEVTSFPFLMEFDSTRERVALCRVVLAAAEVIDTVPSSYDPHDDLVMRHAQALNALSASMKRLTR